MSSRLFMYIKWCSCHTFLLEYRLLLKSNNIANLSQSEVCCSLKPKQSFSPSELVVSALALGVESSEQSKWTVMLFAEMQGMKFLEEGDETELQNSHSQAEVLLAKKVR